MDLICIAEAIQLARTITQKNITPSNISYLIQYGRINRFIKYKFWIIIR